MTLAGTKKRTESSSVVEGTDFEGLLNIGIKECSSSIFFVSLSLPFIHVHSFILVILYQNKQFFSFWKVGFRLFIPPPLIFVLTDKIDFLDYQEVIGAYRILLLLPFLVLTLDHFQ